MTMVHIELALFEECLARPPEERSEWLANNCADQLIRARVIHRLQAHESAQTAGAVRSVTTTKSALHIGSYRLIERTGEDAMGEFYAAEQIEPGPRRVTLKLINGSLDVREVIARFDIECQTLALIRHPSIAHLIDAGATPSGRLYFAMEYVPGVPFIRYCDEHGLSIDARLSLFLQICEAVQYAHQKGVIHQNLNANNLVITKLEGRAVVKVTELGIAKALSTAHAADRAGLPGESLNLTPQYKNYEHAQQPYADIDTRTDVHSLGLVLDELLTGQVRSEPSDGSSTLAQGSETDNPAPSRRLRSAPRELRTTVASRSGLKFKHRIVRLAGDLDSIVLTATQPDRDRRYSSVADFAADIQRHLAGKPVSARAPSVIYRMHKFAVRHRGGFGIAAGLLGAIAIATILSAQQIRDTVARRNTAQFQAQLADASSEFMSLMLENAAASGSAAAFLETGVELVNKHYGADPRFAARMFLQMSNRFMDLGSTGKPTEVLARAATIARDLHDDDLMAAVECTMVRVDLDANRYDEAQRHLQNALAIQPRLSKQSTITQVDCLRAQARVAALARQFRSATNLLNRARRLLQASSNTQSLQYNAVLTELGAIYFRTARFRDALTVNTLSAATLDRNGRAETLAHVTLTADRASILLRLGEVKRAQTLGQEAMQRLQSLHRGQPAMPALGVQYAATLNRLDRSDEAIDLLASARKQATTVGNEHWSALASLHLARSLLLSGRLDQSEATLEEARRSWQVDEVANSQQLAAVWRSFAELELARGRIPEAMRWIDLALGQYSGAHGEQIPDRAAGLSTAARIHLQSGNADKAERLATEALRVAETIALDVRQSADVGEALLLLATARLSRGERTSAAGAIERAIESLSNGLGVDHRLTREAISLRDDLSKTKT